MSDELKARVQSQFGSASDLYATSDIHARGESLALLVELVRPQADWQALDVAAGAGHTALAFAPHVAHVVATDLTEQMLAKTAELAAQRGLANVETRPADIFRFRPVFIRSDILIFIFRVAQRDLCRKFGKS